MKPKLIGIAGSTCSGKTTLINALQKEFGIKLTTLSFDEYFIGSDKYNLDKITNFEVPKLYDYEKFIKDLEHLKNGKDLFIRTNSRESSEIGITKKIIKCKPTIVVEGFLIFYEKAARDLFDSRIFIDLPDDEILRRRFARTKGSTHWNSREYIQNKIIPYHHKYVEPQKVFAHKSIDGLQSPNDIATEVTEYILERSL